MAFSDDYRESIQDKHIGNVGFTSTTKGITNEGYALKNPHQVIATQIPIIDVVSTYGPLTASGIAANVVEEHIVKLTADPTVNNNKAWIAYETNCTTSGHSARGNVRTDQWLRYAETQYKLRLFEDNGAGTAPNYSSEILPSEPNFNWDYDNSAGVVYFDEDPSTNGKTTPLWAVFYTYSGESVTQAIDGVSGGVSDTFKYISDGNNIAEATGTDTLTFSGTGGISITVSPGSDTITLSGTQSQRYHADLVYDSGGDYWGYSDDFTSVPDPIDVYVNGVLNKHSDSEYYTISVVGGELRVSFNFTTDSSDWVCVNYGSYGVAATTQTSSISRKGIETISSGISSVSVSFTDVGTSDYIVNTTLANTVDSSPSMYSYIVSSTASDSFTVTLMGNTDSANYKLFWSLLLS